MAANEVHAVAVVTRILASASDEYTAELAAPIQAALDLMTLQGRWVELGNLSIAMEPIWERRMQSLITIFDTLFFQGELGPVRFEWDDTLSQRGALGECSWPLAGQAAVISVDPRPPVQSANGVRAWGIIGTLLHECCHAVFAQTCASRRDPLLQTEHNHDPRCYLCIGVSGHGPAWQALALGVQLRAQEMFAPGLLDLCVWPGAVREQMALAARAAQYL